jgi:hypothetical protein
MTEVQAGAIAAANEKTRVGRELYEHRTRLAFLVGKLPHRDLLRLTGIVNALLAAEPDGSLLKQVAAYAEGLAEWHGLAVESPDAQISHG